MRRLTPARAALARRAKQRTSSRCCAAPPAARAPPARPAVALLAASCLAPLLADAQRDPAAAVKSCLRAGSHGGGNGGNGGSPSALDNDDRAALSSLVFGAVVLRARLAHQARCALAALPAADEASRSALAAAAAAGEPDAASRAALADDDVASAAARVLLALLLLHGTGEDSAVVASDSTLSALALPAPLLAACRAASPRAVAWPADAALAIAARRSLPRWLAAEWVTQLGAEHADALASALNAPGAVTLRVNPLRCAGGPPALAASLAAVGVDTAPAPLAPRALRLPAGRPRRGLWALPGWSDGHFEVQDEGSQAIALSMECAPGETVLDLCAGNGGKTLAMAAELAGAGTVLAYDTSAARLAALRANAERAGARDAVLTCAGGHASLLRECADRGLDAALVDAPCSGTGALRRRPGARWALRPDDALIAAPALQRSLLSLAAALLLAHGRPRARLVYATCALLRQENADVAAWFGDVFGAEFEPWPFGDNSAATDYDVAAAVALPAQLRAQQRAHERTLLPHLHGTDGFYMARWRLRPR